MLKLTYSQPHCESGSISGKGVEWYWGDRTLVGPEEIVEDISEAVHGAIREKYGDHLTERANEDLDIGIEADIDWDGSFADVTDCKIAFEFWDEADKDALLAEAQESFTTKLEPTEPLKLGENNIVIAEDENDEPILVTITIETKPY